MSEDYNNDTETYCATHTLARSECGCSWPSTGSEKASDEKKSAATVLVELAISRYRLGVSTEGEPFAVPLSGPRVVRMLRGGRSSLRAELAQVYFQRTGRAAPQQALADALLVLEGQAQGRDPEQLALRVANTTGTSWLDLGDATGRVVRVDAAGWQVVEAAPVLFRRTALTGPLPVPVAGGDLGLLWDRLNVAAADRPLIAAALVAALHTEIPHPILALFGEQGTGKTTAARMLAEVLDPSPVPVRKPPRDAESWVTAAAGSWVVALDNLSSVNEWLSDTLCRAVTGDGDVRRQLYSDGNVVVFAFRRVLLLTSIDLGSLRGDLADRLLPVDLHVIDATRRRTEAELAAGWNHDHPLILGALLDLGAGVAGVVSSVRLDGTPRMADFARILAAVDQILDSHGYERYIGRGGELASEALTADPFITILQAVLVEPFEGTAAELLATVPTPEGRAPKGWPVNARAVTTLLKRQAPVMRRAGWSVDQLPDLDRTGVLRWQLTRPEKHRKRPLQPQQPQHDIGGGRSVAGIAGVAGNEYGPSQDDDPPCPVCGQLLDPSLIEAGFDRHPGCEDDLPEVDL